MAGEEGAIIAFVGGAFGMIELGKLLNDEDRWLAASKILTFGTAFLLMLIAMYTGTTFLVAPAQDIAEWGVTAVAVTGVLIIFLCSITWFMRMVAGWVPKPSDEYGAHAKKEYSEEV